MAELGAVRPQEELDWVQLAAYLKAQLPDLNGDLHVQQFYGGHANLTYLLTFETQTFVLRRPPFGKLAPGAHDMKREYRVLSKLNAHYAPAPHAYHYCDDAAIIGAPFVLMERRTGTVVRYRVPKTFADIPDAERRLAGALIDALADLHLVDYTAAGLEKLGRPAGFVQRQLAGWKKRWELSRTTDDTVGAEVLAALEARVPVSQGVAILHNDFKLDNCQFAPNNPDRVSAVFDWDMATLGDPLIDLGTTLCYWPDPAIAPGTLPIEMHGNWPDKQFLIDRYAARTGLDTGELDWYQAFAYWKNGIILQQLYHRYQQGDSTDARMEKFGGTAAAFLRVARGLVG